MKFNNTCPLCRTELTSPNKKFCIKYNSSKRIVHEELLYYKAYIEDNIKYIINTVEYHTKAKTMNSNISHTLQQELVNVFENFGMGICLNINGKFSNFNVYNIDNNSQPNSPEESPTNVLISNENLTNEELEQANIIAAEQAAMIAAEQATENITDSALGNINNLRLPPIT
tara:strand:- start:1217 stop:1729 length:513 start_codon:yes stop_codon:yes gene_type:complete